ICTYCAVICSTRVFCPLLKEAQCSIINVIGGAARTPGPDFLIGGSVNSAFANFAKGIAAMGNRDDINVNVIHPGMVETDRCIPLFEQSGKAQGKPPAQRREESIVKRGPRRIGQPD